MTIMDFVAGAKKGLELIPLFPEKQKGLKLLNELLAADRVQGAWTQADCLAVLLKVEKAIGDSIVEEVGGVSPECEKGFKVSLPHRIAFPLAVWLLENTPEVEG